MKLNFKNKPVSHLMKIDYYGIKERLKVKSCDTQTSITLYLCMKETRNSWIKYSSGDSSMARWKGQVLPRERDLYF